MGRIAVTALGGVSVLDLSHSVGGAYCTKLLADLGADVWKVEPPDGDPVRTLGPFRNGIPDAEGCGLHLHLNANKHSLLVDLAATEGRERVKRLSQRVAVFVECEPPGTLPAMGLGYEDLSPGNSGLIYASITPFGQTGPWRDWQSEEIVDFAAGGLMYYSGDAAKAPLMVPGFQSEFQAGMQAAFGIVAALYHRAETGRRQYIDAARLEAFLSAHSWLTTAWSHTGTVLRRTASDLTPCADEYFYYFQGPFQPTVFLLIDRPELIDDPRFSTHADWVANGPWLREIWQVWCSTRTRSEIYHQAQELRVPVAPVNTIAELVASPQLTARSWFQEVEHPRATTP